MTLHFPAFPAMACVLAAVVALGGGCASRKNVTALGERILFLEREVLAARTDVAAEKEALHDLDLRVQYLEREAARRGVPIPPRPGSPAPAEDSASGPTAPNPNAQATPPAARPAPTTPAKPLSPPVPAAPEVSAPAPEKQPEPVPPPAPSSPAGPGLPDVRESTPTTPAPPVAPATATARPEQRAYDAALQLYRTGRFAESQAAFQAFLEVYPNSRLAANALYWMGETHYSRGQYTDAIFAFKDVQTRFPHHPKTPDSLLKTAMAYQKLGDAANASLHLAALYEDWPDAEATRRAREKGLHP